MLPAVCAPRIILGNSVTYMQDDFKATPTLTLNLGLRYEFYTVAHEVRNRARGGYSGLRRILPARYAFLRTELQRLGSSLRSSRGRRLFSAAGRSFEEVSASTTAPIKTMI